MDPDERRAARSGALNQQDMPANAHNPRHRLVGALVLLALAVILVPAVLDFRSDYEGGIQESNLPPKPEDFHVEVLPLPVPGDTDVAPVPAPPPALIQEQSASPAPVSPPAVVQEESTAPAPASPPAPVQEQAAAPVPKAAPEPASGPSSSAVEAKETSPPSREERVMPQTAVSVAPAVVQDAPSTPDWAVQMGSFSSAENARSLRDRLQDQGFDALVEERRVASKPAYRVLVGPLPDKAHAETMRGRLQRQLGLKGIVTSYEGFDH